MFVYLLMLESQAERDKFVRIYEKYRHFMWYVAKEILQDEHLAEDAVQEAFLALTRHLNKVNEEEEARTKKFMATVTKSKAIDLLRKRNRSQTVSTEELLDIPADNSPDMLDDYITKDNYQNLMSCVSRLDEGYRLVFELKYLHELSDKEIAAILEVTPKVVNVRMFRARKKLQAMLMQEG